MYFALRLPTMKQCKVFICAFNKMAKFHKQTGPRLSIDALRMALGHSHISRINKRSLSTKYEDNQSHPLKRLNEDDRDELIDGSDSEIPQNPLKSVLYGEHDNQMRILNSCANHDELFKCLDVSKNDLNRSHLVQSVVLLWSYYHIHGKSIAQDVLSRKTFDMLSKELVKHIDNMDCNELSCCFLYLRKLGLPHSNILMRDLLLKSLDIVNNGESISLPALSRLIVGISNSTEFHKGMVCCNFLPHILNHIEECTTIEDTRLLSICLMNLWQLTNGHILEVFKIKIYTLINNEVINSNTSKCILKLLHMLNLPVWSHENVHLLRKLLIILKPNISQMTETEIRSLYKIYQNQLEPAEVGLELMRASERLLKEEPTPDMLSCYIMFAEPHKRKQLIQLLKKMLDDEKYWQLPNASTTFFMILRNLKISDVEICDIYWSGVIKELDCDNQKLKFLRHCHHYMNFNNNLGGTYRHIKLEQKISQMAMNMIENYIAGLIPSKFARLSSFVIGYGNTENDLQKLPKTIVSKIISMANQFTIKDCFHMSRGLQIASEMRMRGNSSPLLTSQLAIIEKVFTECTQRHLSGQNLSPVDINAIVRSLNNRKISKRLQIYDEALNKYKNTDCNRLNSRLIREISYNLYTSHYNVPEILEAMFEYIEKNNEYVIGDTVGKVLTCAYSLGYTPQSTNVLDYAARIIYRDINSMSGISILQSCLALCYYKSITDELVSKVFSEEFIQRIEEEIQMCYSKDTYPERVLNLVMQLNRTVCLDFPEVNIPWFQQNYLQAQLSKKPFVKNKFNDDVKHFLRSVLKSETYFKCNHITPYGYRIDFVIHFDKNKRPIPAPVETMMLDRITKVAILLLKLDSFCQNDLRIVRGAESLKMKHLEMMGYKVVHININDWNSKYLNSPDAKKTYLKCLLQIKN